MLRYASALCLLLLMVGCSAPRNHSSKIIDVTNDPGWWGALAKEEVLELKEDALVGSQGLSLDAWIATGPLGARETVSVQSYRVDASRYKRLGIYLLAKGTRVQCVKLERLLASEFREYLVYVQILDGELRGKFTTIPVLGDPNKQGSLQLVAPFLQPSNPH